MQFAFFANCLTITCIHDFLRFKNKKHIFRGMNTITKNQHLEVKDPKHSCKLLDAIEEAKLLEAAPKAKRYTDMDKMWADLDK